MSKNPRRCRRQRQRQRRGWPTEVLTQLLYCYGLLLLTHVSLAVEMTVERTTTMNETATRTAMANCWSNEAEVCAIEAKLYTESPDDEGEGRGYGVLLNIDCTDYNGNTTEPDAPTDAGVFKHNHSARKAHVLLDGCHAPLAVATYGLEYLHNCAELSSVTIKRFQGDATLDLNCGRANAQDFQVGALYFRHNEIATIGVDTFERLHALRLLQFERNSLRYIECLKLPEDLSLQRLVFRQERELALKNASLFAQLDVHELELVALKHIANGLFAQLPTVLEDLLVDSTPTDDKQVSVFNPGQLVNVSFVNCDLNSFQLVENASSVRRLNLANNSLKDLSVHVELGAPMLQLLDLSENSLSYLNAYWFKNLSGLQILNLHGNHFKTLSLPVLLRVSRQLDYVDLRNNELTCLSDTAARVECERTRLQIDGNPWSCMWLLNFTHTQPEKFRLFQYDKYISQLNVNGLACQPLEPTVEIFALPPDMSKEVAIVNGIKHEVINATETPLTKSNYTIIYGDLSWEKKRNQRSEALTIVFLLPLGIAFLFLLLYMWLHCQKIFHLSFYREFHQFGCCKSYAGTRFADRFDVVRLPGAVDISTPTTILGNGDISNGIPEADGYETPVSGQPSICNCQNSLTDCQKTHHVTYESLPSESAYQVYSEIKEVETEHELGASGSSKMAPIYDHLKFVLGDDDSMDV